MVDHVDYQQIIADAVDVFPVSYTHLNTQIGTHDVCSALLRVLHFDPDITIAINAYLIA